MISEDFLAIVATAAFASFPIFAITMAIRNDRASSTNKSETTPVAFPKAFLKPVTTMESTRIETAPHLPAAEWGTAALVLCLLFLCTLFMESPLGLPADPQMTPDPCRAPWFFAGIQEISVFFHPIIVSTVIPLGIIASLLALPMITTRTNRQPIPPTGRYTLRNRRTLVTVFMVIWSVWFLLIGMGFLLRGNFGM